MKRIALFNDTSLTAKRHFGSNLVMRNLIAGLASQDMVTTFTWPVGVDWRIHREELPRPGSVDALVVNAEGTIHHSATRPSAHALAEVAQLAREFGVPAYLVNATLFANERTLMEKIALFDLVFVRDEISLSETSGFEINAKICPDATMAFSYPAGGRERRGTGMTDSCFRDLSRRMKKAASRGKHDFVPMELRTLSRLPGGRWPQVAMFSDDRFAGGEQTRHPRFEPDYFLSWLSGKQSVVTGRYHAVTMALLTATPFVALESNTPKISSLLRSVLGSTARVQPSVDKALEFARSSDIEFSASESTAIARFVTEASQRFGLMLRTVSAHLEGRPLPLLDQPIRQARQC